VARSGAVGVIAALAWERHRGGTRLTFACGGRVVRALRGWRDAVTGCVRALSVLPPDLPAAVERMQNESRDLQKQLTDARLQLAAYEGGRLIANAREIAGIRVVADTMPGWDAAGLKSIATAAVAAGGACVALVSPDGAGSVVIARSSDLMLDANAMLRQLIDRFGGRGGGKKELAQGGGLTAPAADIAAAARAIIESVISG
jgi:alanyl-tRNA synthetase